MTEIYTITIKGKLLEYLGTGDWILIGNKEHRKGAIATKEQYANFIENPAHLYPDGVHAHGRLIAKSDEVIIEDLLDI